jgi:glycine/D-amino acid oxidase-like deaminating enzyme
VASRIGTHAYLGGWIDHRAGSIQPLDYVRGLVRAAQAHGAAIHGDTAVTSLAKHGGDWVLATARGATVRAARVLIATNGYTGNLWPGLRRTVIAANSFIVATDPLPPALAGTVLPGGEVGSDSRRLLLYFRKDAAGRLLLGGRGSFTEPTSPQAWAHLERAVAQLFPQLEGIGFSYRWAGRVAVTRDSLPHVHEPAPGLTIALGYNGRGIAMATTLGKMLAERLASHGDAPFPFPITPISPIPLHALQRLYFSAAVAWYRLLDRLA